MTPQWSAAMPAGQTPRSKRSPPTATIKPAAMVNEVKPSLDAR